MSVIRVDFCDLERRRFLAFFRSSCSSKLDEDKKRLKFPHQNVQKNIVTTFLIKNLKLDDYRHKSYISYPFSKTIFRFSKLDISTDPKMSIFQFLKILLEKIPQNI